jgi:hypothetical protein
VYFPGERGLVDVVVEQMGLVKGLVERVERTVGEGNGLVQEGLRIVMDRLQDIGNGIGKFEGQQELMMKEIEVLSPSLYTVLIQNLRTSTNEMKAMVPPITGPLTVA